MRQEKMIADQLQAMFLEGKLSGFKEEYINHITRKLRTGGVRIVELIRDDSNLKESVLEAVDRTWKAAPYILDIAINGHIKEIQKKD